MPKLRKEFFVPTEFSVAIVEEARLFSVLRLFVAVERVAVLEFCEADSMTAESEPVCFLEDDDSILLWPWSGPPSRRVI